MENTEYQLVNDITKVGRTDIPTVLKYKNFNIKVPRSPKAKCKKCAGKGILGTNIVTNVPIICSKCYPNLNINM